MNKSLSALFTWRTVIARSDLPPTSRHVALTLSLHMNEVGGSCFPGVRRLAEETGLSRNAVIVNLKTLESEGYLEIDRPEKQGRGKKNFYRATQPEKRVQEDYPFDENDAKRVLQDDRKGNPNDAKRVLQDDLRSSLESDSESDIKTKDLTLAQKTRERKPDVIWDALIAAGFEPPQTASERGKWNRVVKELRDIAAEPAQVIQRVEEYCRRWPNVSCTVTALVKHWGDLARAQASPPPPKSYDQRVREEAIARRERRHGRNASTANSDLPAIDGIRGRLLDVGSI